MQLCLQNNFVFTTPLDETYFIAKYLFELLIVYFKIEKFEDTKGVTRNRKSKKDW